MNPQRRFGREDDGRCGFLPHKTKNTHSRAEALVCCPRATRQYYKHFSVKAAICLYCRLDGKNSVLLIMDNILNYGYKKQETIQKVERGIGL